MHTTNSPVSPSAATRSAFFALAVAFASLTLAGIDTLAAHQTSDTHALMAHHSQPARQA